MPKSILNSWTFYFGLLQVLLGAVGLASGLMGNAEAFTLITTGVGSIGLRIKTDGPVILP